MLTIRTDFKFHQTIGCSCFNSHNDVSQVAQRNVSIVAHTRHRSHYLPQPDCGCFVLLSQRRHPLTASQRNVSMAEDRGVVRPSIAQPDCCCCVSILTTTTPSPISAERIHDRSKVTVRLSPNHRYDSLNIYICINCCLLREK